MDQEDQQPQTGSDHSDEGAEHQHQLDELHDLMTTISATKISGRRELDTFELAHNVGE